MNEKMKQKRTAREWYELDVHTLILDPDGWDRSSPTAKHDYNTTLITESQYDTRRSMSTAIYRRSADEPFTMCGRVIEKKPLWPA